MKNFPAKSACAAVTVAVLLIVSTPSLADSESDYHTMCAACHNAGVAGAPKLGDKDAWATRIAKGNKTLYRNAIKGFSGETGVMPPKGGFTKLSDNQIKAIVEFMVAAAQ